MHEVESGDAQTTVGWRTVLEQHHSALIERIGVAVDAERREAAARAVELERAGSAARMEAARSEARRLQTESLHQALRRLRETSENREILRFLNEISAPWAERAVVVVFENSQAVTVAIRGGEDIAPIVFGIGDTPALAAAIESRDMVVALASPAEISPALAALFEGAAPIEGTVGNRAYLFPISVRHSVRAVFIAAGAVVPAPIEVLCEAAGMKLEVADAGPAGILPAAPAQEAAGSLAWSDLTVEDQELHLQAQRMARVRIATLRLNQDEALRRGFAEQDIYGALAAEIEAARRDFLQTFISKSATMVDYLHLEILGSLARDDEKLLGPGYPGPMV